MILEYTRKFINQYIKNKEDNKVKILNISSVIATFIALFNLGICIITKSDIIFLIFGVFMLTSIIGIFVYANCTKQYKICSNLFCILFAFIAFPSLILITNTIDSAINYYYIIVIVLPFLLLEGKNLYRFVIVNILGCIVTYSISYYFMLPGYLQVLRFNKYIQIVTAIIIIGLSVGSAFYYQMWIYKKKQKENEEQRIMLEQAVNTIKAAKQEAEEAKKEAESTNRAKSEFLANMSHEIRTPMNAILGIATLISRDDISRSVREKIEGIESATRSLLSIINDILDISKIDSGKMEIVETSYQFSSIINDVVNLVQYRLEDRPIELKVEISDTLPCELYGDSVRIRQILTNLLSNAEKYTDEGCITLSIDWKEHENAARLLIKVKDTGIGIKQEDLANIFNTFERVDIQKNHTLEGTGLGLSICHKLLEMMGGVISVESEYGVGTTFTVILYQKILNQTPVRMMSYKEDNEENKKYKFIAPEARVLVVDDNLVNLRVAKGLLQLHHLQVDTATSGEEALELLAHQYYDIVFMDHMMPKLDGIETVRIIRKEKDKYNTEIPIIAFTANAISGVKEMFLQEGFKAYLSKPIELQRLEDILLEFLPDALIKQKEEFKAIAPKGKKYNSARGISEKMIGLRKIKGIEIEKGMKHVEYNEDLYIEILKTYCKETSRLMTELLEKNDIDLNFFKTVVHSIKGSSENLGITKIATYARRLESAAQLEDITFIQDKFFNFKEQLEQILNDIEKVFNNLKENEMQEEKTMREVLDLKKIKRLYSGFENYDIDSVEAVLKEFEQYRFPQQIEEFLAYLTECVEHLEYEMGIDAINQYLATSHKVVEL